MQITKPKAILQKALPLFLSLAMLAGLLPVSPLETLLITDAEAAAAASGPRGGARRARGAAAVGPRRCRCIDPQGAAAVGPQGNAVAATPRSYVHTGTASVTAGSQQSLRKGPQGGRLMWAHGGQPLRAHTVAPRLSVPCQWVPGPWLLPGPPTMWPVGFIIARCIRGVLWSISRCRIPRRNNRSDLPENSLAAMRRQSLTLISLCPQPLDRCVLNCG